MRVLILAFVIFMFSRTSCKKCVTRHCRKEAHYLRQSLKLTEDPCVDFYSFACGNFENHHEVPEGVLGWGSFEIADNTTTYDLKGILEEPPRKTDFPALKQAKRMYHACMDNGTRESRGLRPLLHMIRNVGGWPLLSRDWNGTVTWHDVALLTSSYGIPLFFDVGVKTSKNNSSTNVISLDAPSMRIHMPAKEEKRKAVDLMAMLSSRLFMKQYLLDVVKVLHGSKTTSMEDEIDDVLQLAGNLQILSSISGSEVPISLLTTKYPQVDWLDFLQTTFQYSGVTLTPEHIVQVPDWSQLENILERFRLSSSRERQNYIVTRLVMYLAPETTQRMLELLMKLYVDMEIITHNYNDWQYCINKVQDFPELGFGGALAHQYTKRKFHPEKLEKLQKLIDDVKTASDELLGESGWLDTDTISLIEKKLHNISMDFGFPKWMTNASEVNQFYRQLVIRKRDHFGNVARLRRFMHMKNLETLSDGGFRVKSWFSTPFIVNAFYEITKNSVTVPGGIIQHPFFSGYYKNSRDVADKTLQGTSGPRKRETILQAFDYGRIGFLLGHEMSHAFDYIGHLYNQAGTFGNNWTDAMENDYYSQAGCFYMQYRNMKQFDHLSLLLDRTLGEDIADNGGVRKAYRAFKMAWSRDEGQLARLPGLPNFTPEQLFFLGYATNWCYVGMEYLADVHSIHRERVIYPLSNMEEFSTAWNCSKESPMNPKKKCILL